MLGMVLWSDADNSKAVIWCEDQGDLAFYSAPKGTGDDLATFDAGDMVEFDLEIQGSMRKAFNPKLIVEQVGLGLPEALRRQQAQHVGLAETAKIIPFGRATDLKAQARSQATKHHQR